MASTTIWYDEAPKVNKRAFVSVDWSPKTYNYKTMAEYATERAQELFDRGDRYEVAGKPDYAFGCDRKALKALERSFHMRNILTRAQPLPWRL